VTYREAILNAVVEADRLHKEFDSKARAERGEGRIDVFGMLVNRDIPVMFRPLKGLLGAYLDHPDQGVIVTTQRPLSVQRFTAAHEFGHATLGHEASLDEEDILTRAPFVTEANYDTGEIELWSKASSSSTEVVTEANYDTREIQANAFAIQLLSPPWLIVQHMKRQGWTRENLTDPIIVYQLALRMGSSYSATCYALADSKGINRPTCERLLKVKPKTIKQALAKPYEPETWHGDVWLITERDQGIALEGSRSDLMVLRLAEHSGSGYLWQLGDLANAGLAVAEDALTPDLDEEQVGGIVFRTVIAKSQNGAAGHVCLREVRPWLPAGQPLHSLELDVDLSGPKPPGLLPAQREVLLSVA